MGHYINISNETEESLRFSMNDRTSIVDALRPPFGCFFSASNRIINVWPTLIFLIFFIAFTSQSAGFMADGYPSFI